MASHRYLKIAMEGRIQGNRPRGRPPKKWLDSLACDCEHENITPGYKAGIAGRMALQTGRSDSIISCRSHHRVPHQCGLLRSRSRSMCRFRAGISKSWIAWGYGLRIEIITPGGLLETHIQKSLLTDEMLKGCIVVREVVRALFLNLCQYTRKISKWLELCLIPRQRIFL